LPDPDFYFTIEKPSVAEYKDRGSRFIGYVYNIETINDFKERLADIKKEQYQSGGHSRIPDPPRSPGRLAPERAGH